MSKYQRPQSFHWRIFRKWRNKPEPDWRPRRYKVTQISQMTQIFFALNVWGHNLWPQTAEGVGNRYSTLVENSATSIASFKYFILQHQVLHSATSSASFSQRNCLFHPTQSNPSPSAVESITQRSRIHHPAQSNPSPSAVVSVTQRSRIRRLNETYKLVQWRTWCERGSFDRSQDASEITSRRIFCCIGT